MNSEKKRRVRNAPARWVSAKCLCGAVELEIGFPAFWAFHDHSASSRRAHGAAYATYVGCWKSRFRLTKGADCVTRYEDKTAGSVRSFCARCGTPLAYERGHSPKMV
ncbi:MAG: GFA family protein, partial [Parvularculaceae bacterium]